MSEPGNEKIKVDPGLFVLVSLLRFHGIGANPEQLRHRMGTSTFGAQDILRSARDFGLRTRAYDTTWKRLASTPLLGAAELRDGSFVLLAKANDDQALVQFAGETTPRLVERAEFEQLWTGRLISMTRRASLVELSRRFDITWFVGAIFKYKRALANVLVASFFLQLFALVSPLFFKVVID